MKVSVIIPVYCVENYIERCAHSLFKQTMKDDIEFIFVDDRTPDKSIEVLQSVLEFYPERKDQVHVLHNDTNKGLGFTRKVGVKVARGEYIIHCDSDDWVEPQMYELLYNEAKRVDADIVGCDIIEEYASGSSVLRQSFDLPQIQQTQLILDIDGRNLEGYLWSRLFRRSLYMDVGLDNPEVNLWEDLCVSVPAHIRTSKIAYVPTPLYHYNRTNNNSLVSSLDTNKLNDMIRVGTYLESYLATTAQWSKIQNALNNRLLVGKLPLISNRKMFNPTKWRELWPSLNISNYPSVKMKLIMFLAKHKYDGLLKFLVQYGIIHYC